MMNDNDIYIKRIQTENWYNNTKYLDLNKLSSYYSLNKILLFNEELEKYCTSNVFSHLLTKKNLFESKNCKLLCRSGVPLKYMKEFLLKMFNVEKSEENYLTVYKNVFIKYDTKQLNEYVPYFTGFDNLNESLPFHFLNDKGLDSLKEILWMLNSVIPKIEFSPLIIRITSLVLIFCNQIETFEIMKNMLEMNFNENKINSLRWHIRFNYIENYKIYTSMCASFKDLAPFGNELYQHFEKINFPLVKILQDMADGFLLNYLNFNGIQFLLGLFMNEGVKILYRLSYAILKHCKPNLLKIFSPDDIIPEIRKICNEMTDYKPLIESAFEYKLSKNNNKYGCQPEPLTDLFAKKRNFFNLPKFKKPSSILNDNEILSLWSKMPLNFKTRDAELGYSAENNGYSITGIYNLVEFNHYDSRQQVLFLIETIEGEVFGGLISQMIRNTNLKFIRPMESYIVSVRPEIKIYEQNKHTENVLYSDSECLIFVDGSIGPAIKINKDLSYGSTYYNEFYSCQALTKNNEFQIKNIEIIVLI